MSASPPLEDLAALDPRRRQAALAYLAADARPIDDTTLAAVTDCLAVPDKAVQRLAVDLLQRVELGARPALIARLSAALASEIPALRWGAAYALGRFGVAEPGMLPPLLEVLGDRDGDRRWAAAGLLTTCARAHPDRVIPALLAVAADPDAERRKMAFYALRHAAPTDRAVHGAALRGLADPALGVRFAALATLIKLEPTPPTACTLVLALVRDEPDAGLRRAALCALGDVGRGVSAAEVAIAAAETSDDPMMRRAALIARRRLAARV
jgi:HEAT repeat protein